MVDQSNVIFDCSNPYLLSFMLEIQICLSFATIKEVRVAHCKSFSKGGQIWSSLRSQRELSAPAFGQIWKQSLRILFGYFWVSVKCLLTYKISYIKIAVRIQLMDFFEVEKIYCQNLQRRRIRFPKRIEWLDSILQAESTMKIILRNERPQDAIMAVLKHIKFNAIVV